MNQVIREQCFWCHGSRNDCPLCHGQGTVPSPPCPYCVGLPYGMQCQSCGKLAGMPQPIRLIDPETPRCSRCRRRVATIRDKCEDCLNDECEQYQSRMEARR